MNRRSPGLSLSKVVTGFLHYKTAEGLSPTTLDSYRRILDKWVAYVGDIEPASGMQSWPHYLARRPSGTRNNPVKPPRLTPDASSGARDAGDTPALSRVV